MILSVSCNNLMFSYGSAKSPRVSRFICPMTHISEARRLKMLSYSFSFVPSMKWYIRWQETLRKYESMSCPQGVEIRIWKKRVLEYIEVTLKDTLHNAYYGNPAQKEIASITVTPEGSSHSCGGYNSESIIILQYI